MISFGFYLLKRQGKWLFLFLVTLTSSMIFSAASISKSRVALIVMMLCIFFYYFRGGKFSKQFVLLSVLLVFAFPVAVVWIGTAGSGGGFMGAVEGIALRVFHAPASTLYYYFEAFPDVVPPLHGRTMGKLALLMGMEPFDSANFIALYINPGGRISGNANAAFIGNMNADFGMWGVIIGAFGAGVIMQVVQVYLMRQKKTILTLAVQSFAVFAFGLLNHTGLSNTLLSNGALSILILFWIIRGSAVILASFSMTNVLRIEVRHGIPKTLPSPTKVLGDFRTRR